MFPGGRDPEFLAECVAVRPECGPRRIGSVRFQTEQNENTNTEEQSIFIVGQSLTVADLKLFILFHGLWLSFAAYDDIPNEWIAQFKNCSLHYQFIGEMRKVKEFMGDMQMRIGQFKSGEEDQKIENTSGTFIPGSL